MNLETTVSYENKQINDTAQITVGSIDIVKEKRINSKLHQKTEKQ